jgi:hypothetical protein
VFRVFCVDGRLKNILVPQNIPEQASAREKAATKTPAQKGALDSEETWKFDTSFHAYGKMDVRAIGSATRTSALVLCQLELDTVNDQSCETYSKASCAVGNLSLVTSWGLVLRLVRFDILQLRSVLTATPTRSQPGAQGVVLCK